jgi:hypothetical protein
VVRWDRDTYHVQVFISRPLTRGGEPASRHWLDPARRIKPSVPLAGTFHSWVLFKGSVTAKHGPLYKYFMSSQNMRLTAKEEKETGQHTCLRGYRQRRHEQSNRGIARSNAILCQRAEEEEAGRHHQQPRESILPMHLGCTVFIGEWWSVHDMAAQSGRSRKRHTAMVPGLQLPLESHPAPL